MLEKSLWLQYFVIDNFGHSIYIWLPSITPIYLGCFKFPQNVLKVSATVRVVFKLVFFSRGRRIEKIFFQKLIDYFNLFCLLSYPAGIYLSKLTIETLEQGVTYVQS